MATSAETTALSEYPQSHVNHSTIGRLYLDLGLGETAAVATEEWDWFKPAAEFPAALGAAATEIMPVPEPRTNEPRTETIALLSPRIPAASTATSLAKRRLEQGAYGNSLHAQRWGRLSVTQVVGRAGYEHDIFAEIRAGLRKYDFTPTTPMHEVTRAIDGFRRGMLESAPYLKALAMPTERRPVQYGRDVLFAPQSEGGVASYQTVPEMSAQNKRHLKPRNPRADAKLVPLGLAHERRAESTLRKMIAKPVQLVRHSLGRLKMAAAVRLEKLRLKSYNKSYTGEHNPWPSGGSLAESRDTRYAEQVSSVRHDHGLEILSAA